MLDYHIMRSHMLQTTATIHVHRHPHHSFTAWEDRSPRWDSTTHGAKYVNTLHECLYEHTFYKYLSSLIIKNGPYSDVKLLQMRYTQ